MTEDHVVAVVVPTPVHSGLGGALTYLSEFPLAPGTLVRVPLGKREVLGIVWDRDAIGEASPAGLEPRRIGAPLGELPPLSDEWRALVSFSAHYYQRGLGELALAVLPPQLRSLDATQLARRLKRSQAGSEARAVHAPVLSAQQQAALETFAGAAGPVLLFGATGSGKTEIYLQAAEQLFAREPRAQALVMVPEINLTPQLLARFEQRFGAQAVVPMHSGMTPAQRLRSWLAAHLGHARILLGTRLAVFASMPALRLIVVDEEHDPSYKQQEGARYSARDLAVWRGRNAGAGVLLGSATPSLESWHQAQRGRYALAAMPARVGEGALPAVRIVDMRLEPRKAIFSQGLLAAMQERMARGEQSLVLLNRRGYAQVLACSACDWKSECPHCSAFRVFHKIDRTLRCHHCGHTGRVPRACPSCGNVDIATVGRGTERLEEQLAELLTAVQRPDGSAARILRIDADSSRGKGMLERQLQQVHGREVDVLVGTQMIAKGHDFRHVTLVAALNPDGALFSSDFRAPERLFSLLMQAGGRAGRDAGYARRSEMWIQTFDPRHPLFAALRRHDYPAFAASQLEERELSAMPPFAFQALLRADARTQETAQAFLAAARDSAQGMDEVAHVSIYSPVPLPVQRVANVERAQMVTESSSRMALQRFLAAWQPALRQLRPKGLIRWAIDVDPLAI